MNYLNSILPLLLIKIPLPIIESMTKVILFEVFLEVDLKPKVLETLLANS